MLSNKKIIKKGKNIKANLQNYEKMYKTFSWDTAKKELSIVANHKLNAAHIAIDAHTQSYRKNKVALYYEGELENKEEYTFTQISENSNKVANVLKENGIKKGDRVFIFLPRIPELYFSFLGILKTGAIAGTLFSAFQEQALLDRLSNSQAKMLITNAILFPRVQKILKQLPRLEKIIIVERDAKELPRGRNIIYFNKEVNQAGRDFHVRQMKENDSAFMLYTSGTTGKPKGVLHRHLAILQEYMTAKWVLDLKEDDVYWCTADPGWVTGIAYEILGSWANGASAVVFDGRFSPDRWYKIIDEYRVNVWYTAPTAVRMLMAEGLDIIRRYNLSSLRHLASVGEPLNPQALFWGLKAFGLPFHDNWWQTELGAISIANYPCMDIKPGSMGKPIPGIFAEILDDKGKHLPIGKEGNLALKVGFPSLMKGIWRRPKKYKSYFIDKWYISGDKAWKDKNGYFWFIGRADDVIKTGGERVGPFEVESALVEHPSVVEAGVIGKPDPLRGEIIKAFVVLQKDIKGSDKLKEELKEYVKKHLAGHAYPREIEFIDKLPKTRSGKIMRRILKAKELGLPIGDTSTLEEY
ncbi:MAG: acetate--CoA ligase [Candidatus Levybacteria bacterium RIFCSPHIGHO2_02_FULL_37_10]|nr:MAG: acetate--CoA ligase [Candidatus Levybacteria bacterium RIFCSPHIGHO2_02_FULL_37_10]